MASLEELQAQRQRTIEEIQRRKKAGQAQTPDLDKRLTDLEGQIRTAKGAAPGAGGAPPPPGQPGYVPSQLKNLPKRINTVGEAMDAETKVADVVTNRQDQLNNPDQYNPFGSQTTERDAQGNVTVRSKLSDQQQRILDADSDLSATGREMARARLGSGNLSGNFEATGLPERDAKLGSLDSSFNPNLSPRSSTGDIKSDRSRIENEVFNSLTRNIQRDSAKEKDSLEQSLANRGIPIDPQDPQYQEAMRQHKERFDTLQSNAMQDAVRMGGEEYSRDVGVGETIRANDYSQQLGTRGQNAGEASTLAGIREAQRGQDFGQQMQTRTQNVNEIQGLGGMGAGLQVPNFTPYQAPEYKVTSPIAAKTALASIKQGQQAIDIERRKAGGSGGGGGQSRPAGPPKPPPFI